MFYSRKSIGVQALRATMAGVAVSCLGVAVFAAPLTFIPKNKIADHSRMVEHRSAFQGNYQPLTGGPAVELGRAAPGEDEDCVRVTRVTGPDGRIYVSRGLICGS